MISRRQILKATATVPLLMREKRELCENLSTAVNDSVQNHRAIAIPDYLPMPKFAIGQTVRHSWLCDDEVDEELHNCIIWYIGKIIGLNYVTNARFEDNCFSFVLNCRHKWHYIVEIVECDPRLLNDAGFALVFVEHELEAI